MPRKIGPLLMLLALPAASADTPVAGPPKVGVASVVEHEAKAAQNDKVRSLAVRDALFRNERLSTGTEPGSLLHVRLLDDTVITLGPASEMVLDDFALNPAAGTAEVSLKLTRGLLRFAGGQHANAGTRYQVKTPVATIGVRGTSFDLKVAEDGETSVQLNEGALSFENEAGVEVIIDEPNETSRIEDADDAPSTPEISDALDQEFDSLDLSDEQLAEDQLIADELDDEPIEAIVGEDPDEEAADSSTDSDAEPDEAAADDDNPPESESADEAGFDVDTSTDEIEPEPAEDDEEEDDPFSDDEEW